MHESATLRLCVCVCVSSCRYPSYCCKVAMKLATAMDPQFNHFHLLSVPGCRKERMEKDCVSFQQTVTLWVSVEQECFQWANGQLLVSSSFFLVLTQWLVVVVVEEEGWQEGDL